MSSRSGAGDLIGTQFEAASELGMRMHCSRGSMDLSVKDGGLPPDSVVQTVDEIMADSARLIETYHDRVVRLHAAGRAGAVFAVLRLGGACCGRAPSSRGSTMSACTRTCVRQRTRKPICSNARGCARWRSCRRSAGSARMCGTRTAFIFNDEELKLLAETGTGVCHCPASAT